MKKEELESKIKEIEDLVTEITDKDEKELYQSKLTELKQQLAELEKPDKKPEPKKEEKPKKKGNIMAIAKEIQKEGESWKDAVKRAVKATKTERSNAV